LASYRLTEEQVQLADLRLERNQRQTLSLQNLSLSQSVIRLQPQTVQDLKDWIGVSDAALSSPQVGSMAASYPPVIETVASAARNFVFGLSSEINSIYITRLNDWILDNRVVISFFPFNDIYLSAGSQLVVTDNAVLFARYITVVDTAQIVLQGTATKIDCAGFKSVPNPFEDEAAEIEDQLLLSKSVRPSTLRARGRGNKG
jgi:hypothetical protein